jgi:succinate dehydrogenase/fumarate reductase flavoprotein subunit
LPQLKEEFYKDVYVPGSADELNPELEKALRVADFIDLGQLMAMDALQRKESCGGHFREEYQDVKEKRFVMMKTSNLLVLGNTKVMTSPKKSFTKKN